mmetsp:Transcript_847/g.891  ORF Transcript_847/g.891 Transcript_847/m.891 type:complete len:88 (-) Transcript_847:605-868(-)
MVSIREVHKLMTAQVSAAQGKVTHLLFQFILFPASLALGLPSGLELRHLLVALGGLALGVVRVHRHRILFLGVEALRLLFLLRSFLE